MPMFFSKNFYYKLYFILISNYIFNISYLIENGIVYLTLTDKSYPKRLAFLFLEDISREFVNDLKAQYEDK